MENLKVFQNPELGELRTITINNEPWFVGKDVAEALGYAKARNAIATHVLSEDKKDAPIQGDLCGIQKMTVINESGLYALIFGSKLPSAKKFKRWVTSEVIPSIRKHGTYMTPEKIEEVLCNPDTIIKIATNLKAEQERNMLLQKENEKLKPQAEGYQLIVNGKNNQSMNDFAKAMGWGRNRLFNLLREKKIFINKSTIPYQQYISNGYFIVKEVEKYGVVYPYTRITPKGMDFIVKKIKSWGMMDELLSQSQSA